MTNIIFIDPGHGGLEYGAIALDGVLEKDINLKVALLVKELLDQKGFNTLIAREKDIDMSLTSRVNMANNNNADIFISIHHNAANGVGKGAEIIHTIHTEYSIGDEFSFFLAEEFKKIGRPIRRIFSRESSVYKNKDRDYVIKKTKMAAVIGEYCFIDNMEDYQSIASEINVKNEARAYANAVLRFYEMNDFYEYFNSYTNLESLELENERLKRESMKLKAIIESIRARINSFHKKNGIINNEI